MALDPSDLSAAPLPLPAADSAAQVSRPRLFLSYSRANVYLAEQLHADLQRSCIDSWIDTRGLSPVDDHWRRTIASQISSCDELLFLVSPESLRSEEVSEELRIACEHGKPIRHLCLVPIDGLPASLRSQRQLLDWSCRKPVYRACVAELIADHGGSSSQLLHPFDVATSSSAAQLLLSSHAQPLDRRWLDVSPYTRSWLLTPSGRPLDLSAVRDLAVVLRFSGDSDRNTLGEVLEHHRSLDTGGFLLYMEGPRTRSGTRFELPNHAGHIWRDSVEAISRLLHHPSIRRLRLSFYLDAPAVLAMLIGQRIDRDRPLRFFQYVRSLGQYEPVAMGD